MNTRRFPPAILLLAAPLLAGGSSPAPARQAPAFDLVIANGRVMDPASGLDRTGLWVGVRGDSIAAISDTALAGSTVIDAAGKVVAPGFIDVLSYDPNPYGIWRKLADGVTTNLAMHGASADMGAWYRVLGRSRWPVNYGGAFSDPNARQRLGIGRYRAATPAELQRLVSLAAQSMRDGALGVAMSPEYTPGMTTDEVLAMARVAADSHAPVFVH
ncbi:MAG TPA: hypothetical protein VEH83_06965, partial [Gemmatimonadales bacterium]|nr:hypothetical protein [Gemmatimonadales bacterium]